MECAYPPQYAASEANSSGGAAAAIRESLVSFIASLASGSTELGPARRMRRAHEFEHPLSFIRDIRILIALQLLQRSWNWALQQSRVRPDELRQALRG